MFQTESIQLYQEVADVAHHRTYPRKSLQPLPARGGQQRLATSDRRGQDSFQAFGIALAHASGQKLCGGTSAPHSRLPGGQVALGLRAADGQPGQREAGDERMRPSTVSTTYSHDADVIEEVVLVVAAVAMEATFNPAGGTTLRRGRAQPPAPQLVGVIVILRTVE